jgi:hypothetical protein
MLRPEGAREAGHSNILWMGLLTAWCCSTSANLLHHSRSRTIRQRNKSGMKKSEHVIQRAKLWTISPSCLESRNKEYLKSFKGDGSKPPNSLDKHQERDKPLVLILLVVSDSASGDGLLSGYVFWSKKKEHRQRMEALFRLKRVV